MVSIKHGAWFFCAFLIFGIAFSQGLAGQTLSKIAIIPLVAPELSTDRNAVTKTESERLTKELGKTYSVTSKEEVLLILQFAGLDRKNLTSKKKQTVKALSDHEFVLLLGPYPARRGDWFPCFIVRTSDLQATVVEALVGDPSETEGEIIPAQWIEDAMKELRKKTGEK